MYVLMCETGAGFYSDENNSDQAYFPAIENERAKMINVQGSHFS